MNLIAELWRYMRARRKFWLLPLIVVLLVLGVLIVVAKGSAIAPFIYTLF
jgi:competence protein ComGC